MYGDLQLIEELPVWAIGLNTRLDELMKTRNIDGYYDLPKNYRDRIRRNDQSIIQRIFNE